MRIKQGDTWHTTEGENGEPLLVELAPDEVNLLFFMVSQDPRGNGGPRRFAVFPEDVEQWRPVEARQAWAHDPDDGSTGANFMGVEPTGPGEASIVAGRQDAEGNIIATVTGSALKDGAGNVVTRVERDDDEALH